MSPLLGTVEEIVETLPDRDPDEFCRPYAAGARMAHTPASAVMARIIARSLVCGTFIFPPCEKLRTEPGPQVSILCQQTVSFPTVPEFIQSAFRTTVGLGDVGHDACCS